MFKKTAHWAPTLLDPSSPLERKGKHFATFTDVGSQYTFFIPFRHRSDVLVAIIMELDHTQSIFGVPTHLHHSYNEKGYVYS